MTALEEMPQSAAVREYSPDYIIRAGYFKVHYEENSDRIKARVRATAKVKKLGRSIKWVCLKCYPRTIFDTARLAERHADLLKCTVALIYVGENAPCLHQCKKCGIISSCQRNAKYHAQSFEVDGPCQLCDFINKEDAGK